MERLAVVGEAAQHVLGLGERGARVAEQPEHVGQGHARAQVVGGDAHGGAVRVARSLEVLQLEERHAEEVVRVRVLRLRLDHVAQGEHGVGDAALLEELGGLFDGFPEGRVLAGVAVPEAGGGLVLHGDRLGCSIMRSPPGVKSPSAISRARSPRAGVWGRLRPSLSPPSASVASRRRQRDGPPRGRCRPGKSPGEASERPLFHGRRRPSLLRWPRRASGCRRSRGRRGGGKAAAGVVGHARADAGADVLIEARLGEPVAVARGGLAAHQRHVEADQVELARGRCRARGRSARPPAASRPASRRRAP